MATIVYKAQATASATTTLVVTDGSNTVLIASAAYTNVAQQVTAIQGGTGYGALLFTVSEASGTFEMTYKAAGAVAAAPTITAYGGALTVSIQNAGDGNTAGTIACDSTHGTPGGTTGSCTCTCAAGYSGGDCTTGS